MRVRVLNVVAVMLVASWLHVLLDLGVGLYGPPSAGPPSAGAPWSLALVAAGAPALLVGIAVWCVSRLGWRFGGESDLRLLLRLDLRVGRDAVVRIHAQLLALVSAVVLGAWLARRIVGRLFRLQATVLAEELIWITVLGLLVLVPLSVWPLARVWHRPLNWLDERWRLPRPRSLALRFSLLILAPLLWLLVPVLRQWRELLAWRAGVFGQIIVLALAGLVAIAARDAKITRYPNLARVIVAAWLIGLFAIHALPTTLRADRLSVAGVLGTSLLRTLSDVDRDGASAWFGGGDCAPFDATRGPLARDVPGNSIDEDCDGIDAPLAPTGTATPEPRLVSSRSNIVWIILDGVRADGTSFGGYTRDTTPELARFAARATVFERAYAQSSATAFSFASMFTGRWPSALRFRSGAGTPQLDEREPTIAGQLAHAGYDTALFITPWFESTYPGLLRGYDHRIAAPTGRTRGAGERMSPAVTAQAIAWIEQAARPFFATVYFHDPHYPYRQHAEVPRFGERPRDRYDADVAYTDRHVGALLSHLQNRRELWRNTVVVITSDHGEEFGEHGGLHHARTCHRETVRVPLLVRVPGRQRRTVAHPVALVDIASTLLAMVGEPIRELDGVPLSQLPSSDRAIHCAVASQFEQERFYRRSVRVGNFALMHDVLTGDFELYDTHADPGEQRNLAPDAAHAERIAGLKRVLAITATGNLRRHLERD